MDRDSKEIWEAIRAAVESGREDDVVELKSEWYNLSNRSGEAEFLKDVCAMANDLQGPGDVRYIVCGVLDADQCPDRTDAADYVKGVQTGPVNKLNERISQSVKTHMEPYINVRYIEVQHPNIDAILGVLEIRGWSRGWDDRPYVIKEGIHRLRKSQIYVRRSAGVSEPASWREIRLLVEHSQEKQIERLKQEIKDLGEAHKEELQNAEVEWRRDTAKKEQSYKKEITKLERQIADMEQDYLKTINLLQNDKDKLAAERERFKELARSLSRLLWRRSEADRSTLCTCFRRYGMEDWLKAWCQGDVEH